MTREDDPDLLAETYLQHAMRLLDENSPAEAAIAARRAIFLDRKSAFGHLLMGRALRLCGRRNAAKRALERARQLGESFGEGMPAAIEAEVSLLERGPVEVAP